MADLWLEMFFCGGQGLVFSLSHSPIYIYAPYTNITASVFNDITDGNEEFIAHLEFSHSPTHTI